MNLDDFERELKRRPLRRVPPEWKAQVLTPASRPSGAPWWSSLRELFWPSPAAWGTLAALWVAILGLRMATVEPVRDRPARQSDYAQVRLVMEQKRNLQAEVEPPEDSPSSPAIKPRSDARRTSTAT